MGTIASVSVAMPDDKRIEEALQICKTVTDRLNSELSIFDQDSNISLLNNAEGKWIKIDGDTKKLLTLSVKYSKISNGAFDPTVSDLVKLWGFNTKKHITTIPTQSTINNAIKYTGYQTIIISNNTARLKFPETNVDFGGIAKGYAVDVCYDALKKKNFRNYIVNIGGNLRVSGNATPDRNWTIGVRNPFNKNEIIGKLNLQSGMAIATSGNYERFEYIDGKQYAHIIDPRTGKPVTGMAGTTVLSSTAVETDAMSTALYVLGPDTGLSALAQTPDCCALFIQDKKPIQIQLTQAFAEQFEALPAFEKQIQILSPTTTQPKSRPLNRNN
jgi:thiamine biosynthesis lipoprotein